MNLTKIYIITFLVTILSACFSATLVKGDYSFKQGSKKGLVLLSTSINDICGSVVTTRIGATNRTGEGGINTVMGQLAYEPDFHNPDGSFFVYEATAGYYEISFIGLTGWTLVARHNTNPTGIFFEVKENQTTYVGEIELTVVKSCDNYEINIKDNWQRDMNLLKQRVPNINPSTVNKALAKSAKS